MPKELTGAQILLESMLREGVTTFFGYPGGAVIDIYDALADSPLEHILVRHEQGAVHAADGYARASGKVGVCLVTSGPGATNAVTGIATAYADSIPMVIFTGQVSSPLIGNDAFQEVDIVGITRPCTKHNYLVKDLTKLTQIIRQAFYLARTGRPGPVLVDLPKDLMQAKTEFVWPEEVRMRSYSPNNKPNLVQLRRAAEFTVEAKRPLILMGGGAVGANACPAVKKFAERFSIPVVSTLMGMSGFPCDHPLWNGMVGMHGAAYANRALTETDLIIAVGTRFADRVTGKLSVFAQNSRIIHVDIDPTSIRKNVKVDVPVVADCREAMEQLYQVLEACAKTTDFAADHKEWLDRLSSLRQEFPLSYTKGDSIKPQHVIEAISQLAPPDTVVATEVGQHQMWSAQFFQFSTPRTWLTSGGLGTMGYGLPAAMGAQCARPDSLVINVAGDGSIQMNIQEMATIVENKLPVKIVILNNCNLGMVRQWQELFYAGNYMATCGSGQPDFVKLAEAYGAEGYRIVKESELMETLAKALASPNPAIIDVLVDREEKVYPMVPSGAALDEMLLT